jgi:hypothetical protein
MHLIGKNVEICKLKLYYLHINPVPSYNDITDEMV